MTPTLRTRRLLLVPLDTRQLAARVASDDFCLQVHGAGRVHFGPEHPGELTGLYPLWLAATPHPGAVLGTWTVVHRADAEAVGSVGIKGPPCEGIVEIGYGVVPTHREQGLAAEAVDAVCRVLFRGGLGRVETSQAETRVDNLPSQAVLRRCGFTMTGERSDPTDGQLLIWSLEPQDQRLDPQSDRDAGQ